MALANSACSMCQYKRFLGRKLKPREASTLLVGFRVQKSKLVAKTHDNDNGLYDKYTRVSTGLIFSTEVFKKSLQYKILQDIFNLGTHKNIKYLRLVSNVCTAKDSHCW